MSIDRQQPKEYRASPGGTAKLTYAEKLRDVRWKRRRDELIRRANYTCCECCQPLTEGTMDLQVHHVTYIACLDPWMYPDELLLVVCDHHHRERQAVEQAIYAEVGKHLATLDLHQMRRQPIYAFFEEDSTLDCFPAWQREYLRYVRDEADKTEEVPEADRGSKRSGGGRWRERLPGCGNEVLGDDERNRTAEAADA